MQIKLIVVGKTKNKELNSLIENYIKRGLIIPGVTRIEGANGEVGTITQDLLNQLIQAVE